MKVITEGNAGISPLLAFALIPLGGFATDIYIPSLPAMAGQLQVSVPAVQLTLLIFMISSGGSQLFIGSLLDSFGRFRINLAALVGFALASFAIGLYPNIYFIYLMRVVQGLCVSLIIVGKRAFFVDVYSGDRLQHYTSLFSIVWATAPILAPFIGGYLQLLFGWKSNFYFLGIATTLLLLLELKYSGESLQTYQPFRWKSIAQVYGHLLRTPDFTLGLLIIGMSYALLVIYGMASPFIIEKVFHYSPVVTGYSSLLSGIALMTGGIISKSLLHKPITGKLYIGVALLLLAGISMMLVSNLYSNLATLLGFTVVLHLLSGFIFNNVYAYCLRRFTSYAGTASGLTGGGVYIVCSLLSYGLISTVTIDSQWLLSLANTGISTALLIAIHLFGRSLRTS